MGFFVDWLENRNSEVSSEVEGIITSLKNMLSQNSLAFEWGDIGKRIYNLQQINPQIGSQAYSIYQRLTSEIEKNHKAAQNAGARDISVSDPRARLFVQQAIQSGWAFLEQLKSVLSKMVQPDTWSPSPH